MLAAPFTGGVTIYAFYAMQPYLLELYGDERAYGVAGLAAAIVAGAQIAGGLLVPHIGPRLSAAHLGAARGHVARAPSCSRSSGSCRTSGRRIALLGAVGTDVRRGDARASGVPERADRFRASARPCCRSTRCSDRRARSGFSPCSARQPTSGAIRSRTWAARSQALALAVHLAGASRARSRRRHG